LIDFCFCLLYNLHGCFVLDKVDNIVNDYKNSQEKIVVNREEAINQLFALRKRTIRLVDNAKKTIHKRWDELRKINEAICEVQGHTYSNWQEHDGFIDRTWYYTRECEICGKKERVEDEPLEYREQKKGKIKEIKRG